MKNFLIALISCYTALMAEEEHFALLTCMKSGTHYLSGVLEEATGKPSHLHETNYNLPGFVINHLGAYADPAYKTIVLYRDPRDVFVSYTYHVMEQIYALWKKEGNRAELHWITPYTHRFAVMDISSRILYLLDDSKPNELKLHIPHLTKRVFELPKQQSVLCIRFEDIIGSRGGGSDEAQKRAFDQIHDFLGLSISKAGLLNIAKKKWGHSWNFRSGQIGSWKKFFTKGVKKRFKESRYGEMLIKLGYEEDNNW